MHRFWFGPLALVVAGCGNAPAHDDRIDVADVNARNAIARISELQSRVDELESKLRDANGDISKNTGDIATMARLDVEEARDTRAELKRLAGNEAAFREHIDFLRSRQGLPPIPIR